MKLTPQAVMDTVHAALFTNDEVASFSGQAPPGAVVVEGVMKTFAFHPERLAAVKPQIIELIAQLPEPFFSDAGGGWSFIEMCHTRDGRLWTGDHRIMDDLLCLALGTDLGRFCAAREFWPHLPGGEAYVVFTRGRHS